MKRWPEEVNEFLRKNVPGRTTADMTELINAQGFDEKYGITFTPAMIKCARGRLRLRSGIKDNGRKGKSKYPKDMEQYVRSIAAGKQRAEIAKMVSEHFWIEVNENQIKGYMSRNKICSGLDGRFKRGNIPHNKGKHCPSVGRMTETQFKKGNRPSNSAEIGDIARTKEGYLKRKIGEPNEWEYIHRATWEQHHGPIPPGKIVSFLDGNKDNCSIDNLVLIDNEINIELNRKKLRSNNPDITAIGVNIATLSVTARKRKKERRKKDEK